MAPRRTAAQKAAEAAEEAREQDTKDLSTVKDDKSGKYLTIQQLKNKLRNEAEREVLDAHKDEVIQITAAKYKEHGLEYVRRLTDKEKAQKQIEELYAQYPELRPQLQQQHAQREEPFRPARQANAEPVPVPRDPVGYEDAFDNGDH